MAALLAAGGAFCAEPGNGVDLDRPLFELPSDTKSGDAPIGGQNNGNADSELETKAGAGDAEAQYRLGMACLRGDGRDADEAAGVRWLKSAAAQNHQPAEVQLGRMYREGNGLEKNYISAIRLLKKAAEAGSSEAQIELGMMYYAGKGVYKDAVTAYVFLSLASPTLMVSPPEAWADARNALEALETSLGPDAKGIAAERLDIEREKILTDTMRRHP